MQRLNIPILRVLIKYKYKYMYSQTKSYAYLNKFNDVSIRLHSNTQQSAMGSRHSRWRDETEDKKKNNLHEDANGIVQHLHIKCCWVSGMKFLHIYILFCIYVQQWAHLSAYTIELLYVIEREGNEWLSDATSRNVMFALVAYRRKQSWQLHAARYAVIFNHRRADIVIS